MRRSVLRTIMFAAIALLAPVRAVAAQWNKAAFDAKVLSDGLTQIGAATVIESEQIDFKAPEIAENGAIVPIEVTSRLAQTQAIYVFADKNQYPLAGSFEFSNGAEPFVATRIKMSESARLTVVVRADGKFYSKAREVKVTIGGCGP
jgi:sulfur-oxidizing protein SoxY